MNPFPSEKVLKPIFLGLVALAIFLAGAASMGRLLNQPLILEYSGDYVGYHDEDVMTVETDLAILSEESVEPAPVVGGVGDPEPAETPPELENPPPKLPYMGAFVNTFVDHDEVLRTLIATESLEEIGPGKYKRVYPRAETILPDPD